MSYLSTVLTYAIKSTLLLPEHAQILLELHPSVNAHGPTTVRQNVGYTACCNWWEFFDFDTL